MSNTIFPIIYKYMYTSLLAASLKDQLIQLVIRLYWLWTFTMIYNTLSLHNRKYNRKQHDTSLLTASSHRVHKTTAQFR